MKTAGFIGGIDRCRREANNVHSMRIMQVWTVMLLSLPMTSVLAVNKCIEDSGRIFYQDAPCPAHTRGGELSDNANRTFAGQAPRPTQNGGIPLHRHVDGEADAERTPSRGIPPQATE